MQQNKQGMEDIAYLQKPENDKRFKKVRLMVQLLLAITIAAVAVMAIQFYTSVK